MADEKQVRRITALRSFQAMASDCGYVTPVWRDLQAIAQADGRWPTDLIDAALVNPWRATIEEILKQVKFGVHDPVSQLPNNLLRPAVAPGGAPSQSAPRPAPAPAAAPGRLTPADGVPSDVDHQIAGLKAWRDEQIAAGRKDMAGLTDNKIVQVVRSGRRTIGTIAPVLSPLQALASEVLGVILGGSRTAEAPALPVPAAKPVPAAQPQPQPQPTARRQRASPRQQETTQSPHAQQQPQVPAREPEPVPVLAAELPDEFAEYGFLPFGGVEMPMTALINSAGLALSWPKPAEVGPVTVYRVVSDDREPPFSPDKADQVGVTLALKFVDPRPFTTAVRYLQIWSYSGQTRREAVAEQPRLHAQIGVVAPVNDLDIRDEDGRVVGQWEVLPGTERVQILRIPIERAAQGQGNPEFEILAGEPNLRGFLDTGAQRGRRYLYQVFSEAPVFGANRLSSPRSESVAVSSLLIPVTDLSVTMHEDDGQPLFDLRWTQPAAGRVFVYRTQREPAAGVQSKSIAEAALEQAGLAREDRLARPDNLDANGFASMLDIPWPAAWERTYFTPVTVLDAAAHAGVTVSTTLPRRISQPRIVERVDEQILTFAWPPGAASVRVFRGQKGVPPEAELSGVSQEISAHQYQRLGGLHLRPTLPAKGCALHLVPIAFAAGEQVSGSTTTVDYIGLLRLDYKIALKRGLTGRPQTATIRITSNVALPTAPAMVLVINPDRMPLELNDGAPLPVSMVGDPDTRPRAHIRIADLPVGESPTVWQANVKDRTGFIRLFVDIPDERRSVVALVDPPVSSLRLTPAAARRG